MTKLKMHSPDLTEVNIEKLAELFPDCVTEAEDENGRLKRAIDFDQLRQALSDHIVEGPQERYRLDWPGKREALLAANAPIAKTLRPCREESVDFDTTKNLFIEGDNLDALKLLQETYLGKVKMIYIDPPYNTGKDFIYEDDFVESASDYLLRSNQINKEGALVSNAETNGRFHSDWLTMLYPRIRLARNLLRDDGVLFVSIGDQEASNLRKILDEVFGEGNFIANIVWQSRTSISDDHEVSPNHNHILVYSRSHRSLKFWGNPLNEAEYKNPDLDKRGPWKLVPLDANKPGGDTQYEIVNPQTGVAFSPPAGRSWSINRKDFNALMEDGRVAFGIKGDTAPKRKLFLYERLEKGDSVTPSSVLIDAGTTKDGTNEVAEIFGQKRIFDYPKPVSLMERLLRYGAGGCKDAIVLDFFAGSASTAHAVMAANIQDGGRRQYIMVQIPELVNEDGAAYKAGYRTIAEVGKERIRRAGKKIAAEYVEKHRLEKQDELELGEGDGKGNLRKSAPSADNLDIGFRVLKIDSSNLRDVYYQPDAVEKADLLGQVDNIKEDRTHEDLLFQVLLDWGVDLSLPITRETIAGKQVFFLDEDALAACFESGIDETFVKKLAERKPLRAVFRDAGYGSDNTKINVEQIFKLISPTTEVKTI